MRRQASIVLFAICLVQGVAAAQQIKLPGASILERSPALRQNISLIAAPNQLRLSPEVQRRVSVAAITVLLPRVLPASAPKFASVAAVRGIYRVELGFTAKCLSSAQPSNVPAIHLETPHACHYATLLSQTTIVPPADAVPITYKGVTLLYHKPVCSYYCTDGGLYFKDATGISHSIEARGQFTTDPATPSLLRTLYDSYQQVPPP